MKTLIIYDNDGIIYYMVSGDYVTPKGLQYIEVEVPDGKHIVGVNVDTATAIFENDTISVDEAQNEKLDICLNAIMELYELMIGG